MPPQLTELDKIYLWGMQVYGDDPSEFRPAVAGFGPDGDREGWSEFLEAARQIFDKYGDIRFVHWTPYEKTYLGKYIDRYSDVDGIAARVKANLLDLLPITHASAVLPVPSYSLKAVEEYVGYKRSQAECGGDWAMAMFIEATETSDEAKRQELMQRDGQNAIMAVLQDGFELLTQQEAATFLHKSLRVLRFWRTAGIGPAYTKLGKTVLYNRDDLITYVRATLFNLPCEPRSRDMGFRPDEVFRVRWEHVYWEKPLYFNPYGKSRKSRRWIPISERASEILKTRLYEQSTTKQTLPQRPVTTTESSEWVFPSRKAESGHLTTIAKQFRAARRLAGLPESLKLYGARHAFATYAVEATGNVVAVADVMGHEDLGTRRIYQHPQLEAIRDAIDQRNRRIM